MGSGEITNFGIMGGGLSVECHRVLSRKLGKFRQVQEDILSRW